MYSEALYASFREFCHRSLSIVETIVARCVHAVCTCLQSGCSGGVTSFNSLSETAY